jgi:hypothetical protein
MKERVTGSYRLKADATSKEFIGDADTVVVVKIVSSRSENNYVSLYNLAKKEIKRELRTKGALNRKALHFHIVKKPELQPLIEVFIDKVRNSFFDEIVLFVNYDFVRNWV